MIISLRSMIKITCPNGKLLASLRPHPKHHALYNLTPTITMERLPTELVIQILEYMSIEELKIIGFTSSEYRSLVIPFLFRRICPWPWGETRRDIPDLIACLRNNRRLSSVVRVLDASDIGNSQQPLEEIRQIMEITAWWEGLILPVADEHIPLAVFDDNTKLRLCRLKFTQETNLAGPKLSHLLLNILPACVNLVVLEIPGLMEDWFKASDPNGSAITIWMNRLEIYRGPPCPLHYLRNGSPLYQLISKAEVPSPMLHSLGRLAGQKLHTLVVRLNLTNMHQNKLIGTNYLPPSPIPSLFPNLQFAAWFLVMSQLVGPFEPHIHY